MLNRFSYKISDVKVYSKHGKTYADGYIVRSFYFNSDEHETGLGDQLTVQINESETNDIPLEDIIYENHSISKPNRNLHEFLSNSLQEFVK